MKKSSVLKIISLAAFAMAGGLAVANAKSAKKAESASAGEITSGRLLCKFGGLSCWSVGGAKLCAYLTNDSSTYWTSLQSLNSEQMLYVFDYTIDFTPTKLIWVRMDPAATSGNWDQKWNQTSDLGWHDASYVPDGWDVSWDLSQWDLQADVRTSLDTFANPKVTFDDSSLILNSDNNPQLSGKVTLEKDEEFKVVNTADNTWSNFYGCPSALDSAFSGGNKYYNDNGENITCNIPGTYDFYFDTESKRIWISRDDIVEADGWAEYFNGTVGCDASGINSPSGWSDCASAYALLSDDTKDYIYSASADANGDNLGRALATYDYAVAHHTDLAKFIVNSKSNPRASLLLVPSNNVSGNSSNNLIMIVAVVSLVSVSTLVGLIVIKKRRSLVK